jgi:hypothetical protein
MGKGICNSQEDQMLKLFFSTFFFSMKKIYQGGQITAWKLFGESGLRA